MAHKVRTHKWLGGRLEWVDHVFDSLQEAMLFVTTKSDHHVAKVYDDQDLLVHEDGQAPAEVTGSYA